MLMIFGGYYGWWAGIVAYKAWDLKWSIKTKKTICRSPPAALWPGWDTF
jgi:hypothetical protein